MAIDIYDLSFFQDDYSEEEEELTEEERLKLQLEELGLEEEEGVEDEEELVEEEIAATELSVEEPLDDSIYNLEFFQEDSEQEKIEGKQLEYQGDAEGIPFYYDPDTKQYVTAHTRGYKIDDRQHANFPSLLPEGKVVYDLSPKKERELFEYWQKHDPSKIEYFKTEEEATKAAKAKSSLHDEIGRRAGVIKDEKEITGAEAVELGARLERHTIGNVARMIKGGYRSITDDIEYTTALKQIEKERTDFIYKDMKEKYGKDFRGSEDDLRVMASRMATIFTDPVTFLLPWAKAAKMGKLAATGFGAGVGATDIAIYEYAASGHVNPSSLLLGVGIGGASSLAGKVIGDKFVAPKETDISLGNIGKNGEEVIKPLPKMVDEPVKPLSLNEAKDLDDATTEFWSSMKPLVDELSVGPEIQRQVTLNKKVTGLYWDAKKDYYNLLRLGGKGKKGKLLDEIEKSYSNYLWVTPVKQQIQSADTSINVGKMAAAFKKLDTAGVWSGFDSSFKDITKLSTSLGGKGRWSPAGVGTQIGGKIYVHSKYADDVIKQLDKSDGGSLWAKQYKESQSLAKTDNFGTYNTVVFDKTKKTVRLNNSPDFNKVSEPTVGNYFTVSRDGTFRKGSSNSIWHHKWAFVKDDYKGFNVNKSILESIAWQRIINNKYGKGSRADIGTRSGFEKKVSPSEYNKEFLEVRKIYNKASSASKIKDKINMDIGGGKFDNATNFLQTKGWKNYIYDPFNRSAEHNANVVTKAANSQSDTVTVNNVLNVIKEEGNQLRVIKQASNAVKPNGKVYITVYEGSGKLKGTGTGVETTKGWQNNKALKDYLPLVQSEFKDVTIKNGIIEASKPLYQYSKMTKQRANQAIKDLVDENGVAKYGVTFKTLENRFTKAKQWLDEEHPKWLLRHAEGRATLTDGQLTVLAKNEKLSDNILSAVLYEATKPLVGGGIGGAVGAFLDDTDDHDNTVTYALVGAGIFLGALQSRIQKNPYITGDTKQKAFGILDNQKSIILHNFLKVHTAGTTASKAEAHGGPLATLSDLLFYKDMNKVVEAAESGFLSRGRELRGKAIVGAEEATDSLELGFLELLNRKVIGTALDETPELSNYAWRVVRNLETLPELSKRVNLSKANEDLVEKLVRNTETFREAFTNGYVKKAGITFDEIDNFGLPQIYNKVAISENNVAFREAIDLAVEAEWKTTKSSRSLEKMKKDIYDNFAGDVETKLWDADRKFTGVPILNHFHRKRQFTSPEAVAILEPFLETNIDSVLKKWVTSTVKGVEFGRVTGFRYKGMKDGLPDIRYDGLETLRKQLVNEHKAGLLSDKEFKQKREYFERIVNKYFGVHGQGDVFLGQAGKDMMALVTFLSNTTMLTRSSIAQLGDIIQPFQNSSLWSATQGFLRASNRGRNFAQDIKMNLKSSFDKDIQALYTGANPDSKLQEFLGTGMTHFFKYNLMTPLTNWSQRFAFNTGIIESFALSKKYAGKSFDSLSDSVKLRLSHLGLEPEDLVNLNKFKNVEEAFDNPLGQRLLIKAGNKIKRRDVKIPDTGNRLSFAQNKDPYIRSMGMFLSWAQAKTTQLNSLLQRIENGDVALAAKMITGITVFGGLREMQIWASPAKKYYEDNEPVNWSPKWWQEAATLSGNIPWTVEKIARVWEGSSDPVENITPAIAYINKAVRTPKQVVGDLGVGDYEGAVVNALQPVPLARDIINILNSVFGTDIEDEPNVERKAQPYIGLFKGGEVSEEYPVPNAPAVPMERKDRMGNQSYATQASAEPLNPFTGEPYTELYYKGGKAKRRIIGITDNGKYYLTNYGDGSIPIKDAPKSLVKEFRERIV